jgi:hypothetical protein
MTLANSLDAIVQTQLAVLSDDIKMWTGMGQSAVTSQPPNVELLMTASTQMQRIRRELSVLYSLQALQGCTDSKMAKPLAVALNTYYLVEDRNPAHWQAVLDAREQFVAEMSSLSAVHVRKVNVEADKAEAEVHKVEAEVLKVKADTQLTDANARLADTKAQQTVMDTEIAKEKAAQKLAEDKAAEQRREEMKPLEQAMERARARQVDAEAGKASAAAREADARALEADTNRKRMIFEKRNAFWRAGHNLGDVV